MDSDGEIQAGIEITREQDPARAEQLESWLDRVQSSYDALAVDAPAFRIWAGLMHRQSDTLIQDALIAAVATVATVHRLTVVTRNTRHFHHLHVPTLNPFTR